MEFCGDNLSPAGMFPPLGTNPASFPVLFLKKTACVATPIGTQAVFFGCGGRCSTVSELPGAGAGNPREFLITVRSAGSSTGAGV